MSPTRAFTLVEVIVVAIMVVTLLTAGLRAINPAKMLRDAKNRERITEAKGLRNALVQYTQERGGDKAQLETAIGVAIPSCGSGYATIGTGAGNANLTLALVPTYISAVPLDPTYGTTANTGYKVCRTPANDYCVLATTVEGPNGGTWVMHCDFTVGP